MSAPAIESEFKLPTVPTLGVLVGRPRSGKSHMVEYLLHRYKVEGQPFKSGIVYSSAAAYNGDFDKLPKGTVFGAFDADHFEHYITELRNQIAAGKQQHGMEWEMPPNFIIFEDCIPSLASSKFFQMWLCSFRSTNTYPFITSQYLETRNVMSTLLREYAGWAMMWPTVQKRTLTSLGEAFGGEYDSNDEFVSELKKCKEKPHQCLVYLDGKDSKEDTYSRYTAGEVPADFKFEFKKITLYDTRKE